MKPIDGSVDQQLDDSIWGIGWKGRFRVKKRILAMLMMLVMLCTGARAASCAICGGDGICDTCGGKGYQEVQAYSSNEKLRVACPAGCDNGWFSISGATIAEGPEYDLNQVYTFADAAIEAAVCEKLGKGRCDVSGSAVSHIAFL